MAPASQASLNRVFHSGPLSDEEAMLRGIDLDLDVVMEPKALPQCLGYGDLASLRYSHDFTSMDD